MRHTKQRFLRRKTAELALHVLNEIGGKKGMTIEHLQNVMFQIDKEHFIKTGRTITGAKWFKGKKGMEF